MISQNGWAAGERPTLNLTTITVPGTATKIPVLAGDVATVLLWVATRWHNEVEPLVEPGNWGYAYRTIRGATTGLSNHASGTAIDLNAPKHPLGTEPSATMSKEQVAAAKRIEADSGGVVRWGGSYTGRKDPMHWEINAGTAAVAALAARIRGGNTPPPAHDSDEEDQVIITQQQWDELDRKVSLALGVEIRPRYPTERTPGEQVMEYPVTVPEVGGTNFGSLWPELFANSRNSARALTSLLQRNGADVDEAAIVKLLAPIVIAAIGQAKELTAADVEAAVRRVFADAGS